MQMKSLQVLLVDDNSEFLSGITNYLSREPHFSVAGTARSSKEAIDMADKIHPDLILLDISMPGVNGLETARLIRERDKSTKIVMLTLYDIEEYRTKSRESGTDGFIPKADFVFRFPTLINELFPGRNDQSSLFMKKELPVADTTIMDKDIVKARPALRTRQQAVTTRKLNCWEFKNCNRGPGSNGNICSAATEMRLEGVHDGKNAGRACWAVAGTLCGGIVQGTFAKKYDTCEKCEFYRTVKKEEAAGFVLSATLLAQIR